MNTPQALTKCPFAAHENSQSEHPVSVNTLWEAEALSQCIAHHSRDQEKRSQGRQDLTSDARLAWRNSIRCIARPRWQSLNVIDARELEDPDDIFDALRKHLRDATNCGNIRSMMTVFSQWEDPSSEIRIWNHQLLRYACHRARDNTLIGDPMNRKLTELALALGWNPPQERSAFDLLPLIIQAKGRLSLHPITTKDALEVSIQHPKHTKIDQLGLKWYALPVVADMLYATPDALHTAAPFSGHYMATEIGARNLADRSRYNQLPRIAHCIGVDTNQRTNPLWKDHAMLALQEAVLHSFEAAGVRIENHHEASERFTQFCKSEQKRGRSVYGDWTWLVPPMSGSANSVFHQNLKPQLELPNFFYQKPAWKTANGQAILAKSTGNSLLK
jgi:nitric-oxide synthase, bacterial